MKAKTSARGRSGLATMHQGAGTTTRGSAKMAGNTRGIMAQGKTKRHAAPVGNVSKIMGQ